MDYILKEMNEVEADGVDFVPIWFGEGFPPIICSYTKEEWQDVKAYPKSNRMYWKMVNGKKEYVNNICKDKPTTYRLESFTEDDVIEKADIDVWELLGK